MILGVLCTAFMPGCMSTQLRNRITEQASTIPDVYHQVILNNMAMMHACPSRMPYFSDPQTSRVEIVRTVNVNTGSIFDTLAAAPVAILAALNNGLVKAEQSVGGFGEQSRSGEWSAVTSNDPDKLFLMRAVYHRTLGVANEEDRELLSEFYYRHFQITDECLARLRDNVPEVYAAIGPKLARLKDIEYLTVELFEKRLAERDILGPDDVDRYRRPILKFARMENEPTQFVSDADTHHLLYVSAQTPGWYGVGTRHDVPKNAAYVGRYGPTYVWVEPQNLEMMTRLTLAILDIHTFRSHRFGEDRVLPGLLPR